MGGDDGERQPHRRELDLLDPQPFGERKQWGPFHSPSLQTLRLLEDSPGKDCIMACQRLNLCKRALCTKSPHEPYLGEQAAGADEKGKGKRKNVLSHVTPHYVRANSAQGA